jgi:hypothetical protein
MTLGGERGSVQNPFIDYAAFLPPLKATSLHGNISKE